MKYISTIILILLLINIAIGDIQKTKNGLDIPHNHPNEEYTAEKKDQIKETIKKDFNLNDDDFKNDASTIYNCHAFTFGKSGWVYDATVILEDDGWLELPGGKNAKAKVGDIVVYKQGGMVRHTGKVIEVDPETMKVTKIQSKWGSLPEIVHSPDNVPKGNVVSGSGGETYSNYGDWTVFRQGEDKKEPKKSGIENKDTINFKFSTSELFIILPAGECSITYPSLSSGNISNNIVRGTSTNIVDIMILGICLIIISMSRMRK